MVRKLFELVVLVISFFIPNLIIAPYLGSLNLLDTNWLLIVYISAAFLQFLFMYSIVKLMRNYTLEELGFEMKGLADFRGIIAASTGILAIYFLFSLSVSLLPSSVREGISAGYRWKLSSFGRIPLIILFCLVTGYREEFLFRSYLLSMLKGLRSPWPLSLSITTILFALLHSYEGIGAMIFAGIAGFYFALIFLKKNNLHVIALAHSIYNALIIILSLLF